MWVARYVSDLQSKPDSHQNSIQPTHTSIYSEAHMPYKGLVSVQKGSIADRQYDQAQVLTFTVHDHGCLYESAL